MRLVLPCLALALLAHFPVRAEPVLQAAGPQVSAPSVKPVAALEAQPDAHGNSIYLLYTGDAPHEPGDTVDTPLGSARIVAGTLLPPRTLSSTEPKVPKSVRKSRQDATVLCRLVIEPDGSVGETVVTGAWPDDVVKSSRNAVLKYRFAPTTLDGKPVAVRLQVEIHHQLFDKRS